MVFGVRQNFQYFKQITFFIENNRALSKFLYGILQSVKANFVLTTLATLNLGAHFHGLAQFMAFKPAYFSHCLRNTYLFFKC